MHFHVDIDNTSMIAGWLVLDNPSETPEFLIKIPNRQDVRFKANVTRLDIRDLGMHASGQVGFHIDEQLLPGLRDEAILSIIEPDSGLQIYQRVPEEVVVDKKIFFLDPSAYPQIKILRKMMKNFKLSYPMVQRFSLETINSIFFNNYCNSILVFGQPNWQRHGSLAREKGFFNIALLRDPFEELAERLQFLIYLSKQDAQKTSGLFAQAYLPLSNFTEGMDVEDEKSILTAFRRLSADQRRLFRSPATSTLGATPDEELQRRHVTMALDNLAYFDVVGTRQYFNEFVSMIGAVVDGGIFPQTELETIPGVQNLAEKLRRIGLIADLLDEDIALYSFASSAVEMGLRVNDQPESL
ncbi:hypothetical protein [Pararhizobium sp. DWP3-4]|uniref:hypothetical protein n=1 Tax=Pararhizobium sp. DWP3-4 TaxID=2804565 RepID=UPI003CE9A12F